MKDAVQAKRSQRLQYPLVVTVALICVGGTLFGVYLGSEKSVHSAASSLVVPSEKLDFGVVWAQPEFSWTLPVTNSGDRPVTVSDVVTSCSCSSVEPRAFIVEAGQSVPLQVELNLRKQPPPSGQSSNRFQTTFVARVANGDSRIEWKLQGTTKHWIEANPDSITLGRPSERALPSTPKTFRFHVLQPINGLTAESESDAIDVAVDRVIGGSPNEYELSVSVPRATAGLIDCDLQVSATANDGTSLPALTIPVRGQVVRDVQPIRIGRSLGIVVSGASLKTQIRLHSLSGSPFEVLGATCRDSGIQVRSENQSSKVFSVSGIATGRGMQSKPVEFAIRHPDGMSYEVKVAIRYVAVRE